MSIKTTLHATAPLLYPCPEVPKLSVGAICFTSSGSNGGCWVVLVSPPLFFPYATYAKKKVYATYTQTKIAVEKKATYAKTKSYATCAKKR